MITEVQYNMASSILTANKMDITIGIVDDQQLFVKSLALTINTFAGFQTILEAFDGEDVLRKLQTATQFPDVILLDVHMERMDGLRTAAVISEKYPAIKIIALSQYDEDTTIIGMIKAGCCSYLLKSISPDELEKALTEVYSKGFYNADALNINYRRFINLRKTEEQAKLTKREMEFIQLACSDRTYKQIAADMKISERTIDGYRESVFEKLNVESRVGMALEAIRKKLVVI